MPSWCRNLLDVSGPPESLARLRERLAEPASSDPDQRQLCFERILPIPPELLAVSDLRAYGWPQWCNAHWGTDGEAHDVQTISLGAPPTWASQRWTFETPWSPPLPLIAHLATNFPELAFDHVYATESDMAGWFSWRDGAPIETRRAASLEDCAALLAAVGRPEVFGPVDLDVGVLGALAAPTTGDRLAQRMAATRHYWGSPLGAQTSYAPAGDAGAIR
jgi:hypothetical protein